MRHDNGLNRWWWRRRLRQPHYLSLLDPAPKNEWISVDCETTGLNPRQDEIISIGAIPIRGNQILTSQRLELLIKPSGTLKKENILIHRLRHKDLESGLLPSEAAERFLAFVGNRPLVGYYLEFDVAMLNRLVRPFLGVGLPQPRIEVSGLYYDYKFAKRWDSNVDLSFEAIRQDLGLPAMGEAHDATSDALMAALMFVKLRRLLKMV